MGNDEIIKDIVGLVIDDARKLCKDNNMIMNIIREDDINNVVLLNFRFDRVNVDIDDGIITKCSGIS